MRLMHPDYVSLTQLLWITFAMAATPALAGPPQVEPCSILTKGEVEQIVGKLKGPPKADKEGDAGWCNYEFANGNDAMEVWVFPADGLDRGRKRAKKPLTVAGLGQGAFMDRGAQGLDYLNLFVKKGEVTVEFSLKETAGDEEKLKALAQKALSRL